MGPRTLEYFLADVTPSRRMAAYLTLPIVVVILLLTALSVVYSVNIGSEQLDGEAIWQVIRSHLTGTVSDNRAVEAIVWELRLPRALLAAMSASAARCRPSPQRRTGRCRFRCGRA